jgi:hypothetical protein
MLTLREWLTKIPENAVMTKSASHRIQAGDYDPFQGYERVRLEELCVKIASILESRNEIILFLFDFGEKGNLAFKTNIPDARQLIQKWVYQSS